MSYQDHIQFYVENEVGKVVGLQWARKPPAGQDYIEYKERTLPEVFETLRTECANKKGFEDFPLRSVCAAGRKAFCVLETLSKFVKSNDKLGSYLGYRVELDGELPESRIEIRK